MSVCLPMEKKLIIVHYIMLKYSDVDLTRLTKFVTIVLTNWLVFKSIIVKLPVDYRVSQILVLNTCYFTKDHDLNQLVI